ncbi:MAG: tetratricopeptide repeat protein [Tannerellaceae bacterium]|jgi:tetratricopeptide (TPR) repeat protein|nr:tetratricopeptide repeat protein [Tannerellaceae bacterium]
MTDDLEKSFADALHILNMYYTEDAFRQALEYAQRIKNKYEQHFDPAHEGFFDLYLKLGILYGFNGMHAEQLEACLKAQETFHCQISGNPEKVLAMNRSLLTAYKDMHYYPQALECAEKTMALFRANPELYTDIAELDINAMLADLYRLNGMHEKAIEWYLKCNELYARMFGRKHEGIAHGFRLIAHIYSQNDQQAKALTWLLKSLALLEKLPNKDCPALVLTHSALALQYAIMGQSAKASEYLNKMIAAFERAAWLPRESRILLAANICGVLLQKGEYKQALEWQKQSVSMSEKYYGKEDPKTAIEYNNLAEVYTAMGNHNMAIKYNTKAFNLHNALFGLEHAATISAMERIGQAYAFTGNHDKAEEILLSAIENGEKLYGKNEPYRLLFAYLSIARSYTICHKMEQAEQYFDKAVYLYERFTDKINTRHMDGLLNLLAQFYMLKPDYGLALKFATMRYEFIRKTHNKDNNLSVLALCEVARCHTGLQDYNTAIELYLQAIRSFISRYGLNNEHCQAVWSELLINHKLAGIQEEFSAWFIRQIEDIPLHKIVRKPK